ncbi:MAG: SAM-dependent methyltransferase [Myxococcota bacterium]|nr:SAM-dependent methyltransferase [Myxococcota bacterium]
MENQDTTGIPNAGRVYDYLLGGHHNYEVDRRAAEFMTSLVPSTPKWVRKLRRFLHYAVSQLAKEGFDRFLDLASGLPTKEHIHSTAPESNVIYMDINPGVVVYGTQILDGNPRARYLEVDIRDMATIVNSPIVKEMLGETPKVGIGFNAVTCFLTEDEAQHIVQTLYNWAAPGSKMFVTFETKDPNLMTPKMQQFLDMFAQMGSPYYFTTLEKAKELIKPWKEDGPGLRPLDEWLDLQGDTASEDREGVGLEFYGAMLKK